MSIYEKDQPAIERGRRLGDFLVEGQRRRLARGVGVAPLAAAQKMLIALGDSWFAYWPRGDVLDVLERKFHYNVDSRARAGSTLAEMIFEVPPGDQIRSYQAALRYIGTSVTPQIGPVEVVSVYRNAALNSCAGGAATSTHLHLGAIDREPER